MAILKTETLLTLASTTATTTGSAVFVPEKHNALLLEVATLTEDSAGEITSIEIQHASHSAGTFKTIHTFGPYSATLTEADTKHIIPEEYVLKGTYRAVATIASGTWSGTVTLAPALQ